ncbi:MAG TPA: hypothetical protein VFW06_11260 [Acidimicrobiia bacterium]|nr:hypothetical protein [Acidimicrobiia bacterium]
MRRLRWIVPLLLLVVAAAAAAAYLLVEPDLSDGRDQVDAAWTPLRAPLTARYEALGVATQALVDAGAGERAVTKDLTATLERWNRLALRGPAHTRPGVEASIANELEALARRARANVTASARLNTNQVVTEALGAFDLAVIPPPLVRDYNRAVREYQDARGGTIDALVAKVLSFDPRPVLQVGT